MKNKIFCLFLCFTLCQFLFAEEQMKISIRLAPFYNSEEFCLYNGSCNIYKELISKIHDSKEIKLKFVDKESVFEGDYILEIMSDGEIKEQFIILNENMIYETFSKKYFKCSVLNEFRKIALFNLLNERYKSSQ